MIPDYVLKTKDEYIRKGYWKNVTLYDLWEKNARQQPHKEAVVDRKNRLTWSEAKVWIDSLAHGLLELGLKKGDVLAIQLPNSAELCLLRVACEKAGILSLPILRTMRDKEVEYILRFTGAAGIAIPWQYRGFNYFDMIKDIHARLPALQFVLVSSEKVPEGAISLDDMLQSSREKSWPPYYLEGKGFTAFEPSLLFLTSGSTGFPKFVQYAAVSRLFHGSQLAQFLELNNKDILAALAPAAGGPNIPIYYSAPLTGAKIVLMEHFEPEAALDLIEKEKVTVPCAVPSQLAMLLQSANQRHYYGYKSVRAWYMPASALSSEVARDVEDKIGGIVINGYGAVDFGGSTMPTLDDSREVRFFTVGRPIQGTEFRLVDDNGKEVSPGEVGEIQGRSASCAWGYFRDPEAVRQAWTEDGWFKTGDLGKWDGKGNLIIAGRKKEMIIRGGQNIYPSEIESLLQGHPKVQAAAVVSMPDAIMGEKACAYVVPEKGVEFSFKEMISFLKEKKIAAYKLPERLEIIPQLPMVSEGQKIDKKALREDIANKLANEASSPFTVTFSKKPQL